MGGGGDADPMAQALNSALDTCLGLVVSIRGVWMGVFVGVTLYCKGNRAVQILI